MSAEALSTSPEPIFDPSDIGLSLDQVNELVLSVPRRGLMGIFSGETTTALRGEGAEIDGIREYVLGDERRKVDWKATARRTTDTMTLMAREHYRDITPNLWLVTDSPQDKNRANPGYFSKQDLALSALLAFTLIARRESMPTNMIAANEHTALQSANRPLRGRHNLLNIGRTLSDLAATVDPSTDKEKRLHLSDLISQTAELVTRSVVVVVSDFRDKFPHDEEKGWGPALTQLASRKNAVLAVEVTSPWDFELPEEVDRLRTGKKTAWIGGRQAEKIRQRYKEKAPIQQESIDQAIADAGAKHIKLSTDNPAWFTELREQLVDESHLALPQLT